MMTISSPPRDATDERDAAEGGVVVFVGELGRGGKKLADSLEALGYVIRREASVGGPMTQTTLPPIAVLVECGPGRDPFRVVRRMRAQPRYQHALVFVYGAPGTLRVGEAVASGADDLLDDLELTEDAVDRVAGRFSRARMLEERAMFDVVTQGRNRRFVAERLSLEIAHALAQWRFAAFGVSIVHDAHGARGRLGRSAMDRALEELAFALRARVRPFDVVSRMSDDTFIVLAPGLRARRARTLLAAPKAQRAELAWDHAFVEAPRDGITWETLFARAEHALQDGGAHDG